MQAVTPRYFEQDFDAVLHEMEQVTQVSSHSAVENVAEGRVAVLEVAQRSCLMG